MSPADSGLQPDTLPASPGQHSAIRLDDCWNRIGVFGDRSCPELTSCVHCRNCPVFSAAGRSLLERLPPSDYLKEWTTVLAETQRGSQGSSLSADGLAVRSEHSLSVMIFRLQGELLALPVGVFLEVSAPFVVHSVPGRSNALFLGMVNVRGEIMLAASLSHLLGLKPATETSQLQASRMAVAGTPEGKWVFPIDEIHGIYLFHREAVRPAPVVISQAGHAYGCGVFQWQNHTVALLDPERIFAALNGEIASA